MKFLLDVCASSRALRTLLTDLGHDVLSALDRDPRASDEALLGLAMQEARVLITEDKDFGELVERFVNTLQVISASAPLQWVQLGGLASAAWPN
jgi:predicted nuclease of predicted toxin-antitoxin system